jgi:hypothetical protein
LLQKAHGVPGEKTVSPSNFLPEAGEDPEKVTFFRSVEADYPYLRPVEIGQIDILQYRLPVVIFAHPDHGVNDLVRLYAHRIADLSVRVIVNYTINAGGSILLHLRLQPKDVRIRSSVIISAWKKGKIHERTC